MLLLKSCGTLPPLPNMCSLGGGRTGVRVDYRTCVRPNECSLRPLPCLYPTYSDCVESTSTLFVCLLVRQPVSVSVGL
jgi:hypothetical protein